jgi:hypothetical protein
MTEIARSDTLDLAIKLRQACARGAELLAEAALNGRMPIVETDPETGEERITEEVLPAKTRLHALTNLLDRCAETAKVTKAQISDERGVPSSVLSDALARARSSIIDTVCTPVEVRRPVPSDDAGVERAECGTITQGEE